MKCTKWQNNSIFLKEKFKHIELFCYFFYNVIVNITSNVILFLCMISGVHGCLSCIYLKKIVLIILQGWNNGRKVRSIMRKF